MNDEDNLVTLNKKRNGIPYEDSSIGRIHFTQNKHPNQPVLRYRVPFLVIPLISLRCLRERHWIISGSVLISVCL